MVIKVLNGRPIISEPGKSVYQSLRDNGIYLVASCGGKGVCGKCRVRVVEGKYKTESATKLKKKDIGDKVVLACTTFPEEDILIEIPDSSKLVIGSKIAVSKSQHLLEALKKEEPELTPPARKIMLELPPPTIEDNISDMERIRRALSEHGLEEMIFSHSFSQSMSKALRQHNWRANLTYTENSEAIAIVSPERAVHYGLAVDIGTTTVVVYLINCSDGTLVDTGVTYNSQMRHGDDVITRIVHATEGGAIQELRNAVINDINSLLNPLMEKNRISRDDIDCAVISGNTTMSQLFWGLDPSSIREEPYIPTINSYPAWHAGTARLLINQQAPVFTMPCVGSYVGGDITAGVLASAMYKRSEIALFMDIGTNGEIVVGNDEWLITAATSAGPCFEGSGIRHGMRATDGAIESIKINPETFDLELNVIGNSEPAGICGSGMIDAISELFFANVIDQKGKFRRDLGTNRIRIEDEGPEFVLHFGEIKDIVLTEVDIENILRAKAAIYAGMAVLLKEVGLSLDVVERIYIAGGFGNYLNIEKAIMIGMLPDMPLEKFSFIGNSSIAGAYLCLLSGKMRREAENIAKRMTYIELSVSRGFMDEYMSALFLPHTDIDLFPSFKEKYSSLKK